jgi:hypothetical protein
VLPKKFWPQLLLVTLLKCFAEGAGRNPFLLLVGNIEDTGVPIKRATFF